ncbi:uncharacterized protein TNCV_4447051 [Trichonephila clavipes]|nr:uncharacterized protein TNCV_4447051 [Trichonephila clavipes]
MIAASPLSPDEERLLRWAGVKGTHRTGRRANRLPPCSLQATVKRDIGRPVTCVVCLAISPAVCRLFLLAYGTVESTDTIAKLKTKIEKSSTFESDADFVKTLIKNCIDERVSRNEREATLENQKTKLAKLQLAQLEKDVELQTAKNEALSLNPAAKVEEKQFETNIENMIKSIKTLSLPVPTRSENFNLFF